MEDLEMEAITAARVANEERLGSAPTCGNGKNIRV